MIRVSTIFVAICMVLIAGSLGFLLYRVVGLPPQHAAIGAFAALTVLFLFNAISMRLHDRNDMGGQIADLAQGTTDLARQVAEFARRLHAVEHKLGQHNPAVDRRVDPLRLEIAELGQLMKQVAVSVAEHDDAIRVLNSQPERMPGSPDQMIMDLPQPVEPPAPAAAPIIPPQTRTDAPVVVAAPAPVPAAAATVTPLITDTMTGQVNDAVDAGRIDLYLQPMVTLPQRKVRYYEALARLRDGAENVLPAADFIPAAEKAGALPRIDEAVLLRCVQVLRRLMARNKDVGLFCNMSAATLADRAIFTRCLDFLDANHVLASSLVLEFKLSTFRSLGPLESNHLAALAQRGFKFSIDHVTDLRLNARELADRGVRFVKVPASLLLDPTQLSGSDLHPSDLSDMLSRFGIDLIAERIEGERAVVDLLDFDVRYGQGFLFAPPRPLRPDAISAVDNPAQAVTTGPLVSPEATAFAESTPPVAANRGIAALLARRMSASN